MFGHVEIKDGAVQTARTSYKLDQISVVSCIRPFLAQGIMMSVFLTGFGFAFSDILYQSEILTIGILTLAALGIGLSVGQLKLLSHDLRGSELSTAVYGFYHHLKKTRLAIFSEMNELSKENPS